MVLLGVAWREGEPLCSRCSIVCRRRETRGVNEEALERRLLSLQVINTERWM